MARLTRLFLSTAVVLSASLSGFRAEGAVPGAPIPGWQLPLRGLDALAGRPPQGLIEGRRLHRDLAWGDLRWEPRERVAGLYVEIEGRVRFREAAVLFADGNVIHLDLRRAVRAGGLFALAEFDTTREVAQVAIMAQAVSGEADVALRIMPGPPAP